MGYILNSRPTWATVWGRHQRNKEWRRQWPMATNWTGFLSGSKLLEVWAGYRAKNGPQKSQCTVWRRKAQAALNEYRSSSLSCQQIWLSTGGHRWDGEVGIRDLGSSTSVEGCGKKPGRIIWQKEGRVHRFLQCGLLHFPVCAEHVCACAYQWLPRVMQRLCPDHLPPSLWGRTQSSDMSSLVANLLGEPICTFWNTCHCPHRPPSLCGDLNSELWSSHLHFNHVLCLNLFSFYVCLFFVLNSFEERKSSGKSKVKSWRRLDLLLGYERLWGVKGEPLPRFYLISTCTEQSQKHGKAHKRKTGFNTFLPKSTTAPILPLLRKTHSRIKSSRTFLAYLLSWFLFLLLWQNVLVIATGDERLILATALMAQPFMAESRGGRGLKQLLTLHPQSEQQSMYLAASFLCFSVCSPQAGQLFSPQSQSRESLTRTARGQPPKES